ncbi:translation factor GTPase family protein [Lachnospiraceae bacterium 46-15]
MENKLVIGILAHVDAGKTTLSEGMLYLGGSIRKMGRVDHGDAFLDTYSLERARGITIFSKQAVLNLKEWTVTLLDTPGHVDFSAEMERTLSVLDYAVLVINGADGVQGHTQTLWRLLHRYKVPVFLFVNKMDQEGTDKAALLEELKRRLDDSCVDFTEEEAMLENIAMCEEAVLEEYLETGGIAREEICRLIGQRKVFPCWFGSALRMTGVEEFMAGLAEYMQLPDYPKEFGARVFKISRDEQGNRLTHMKITGGSLKVKTLLDVGEGREEKADQIRIYSGARYEAVPEAEAGTVCAVTGLSHTKPGQGIGLETETAVPVLEPVLTYRMIFPEECNVHTMLPKLRELEEEEPELHIVWDEELNEIHAQMMGEVQIEVLKSLIGERFGVQVEFGEGNIVYKETILEPVEGVGHFEPLRHYAEVHLLLEPAERGSGLQFAAACSEDMLDRNWQRLVLTHLEEKEHRGVLTGSAVTDMKITLVSGKAHLKHTEGGDFRQATYRAVRQGLKKAKSILLEPYYDFRLEVPAEMVGRAMTDIRRMEGTFEMPGQEGGMSVLTGSAPVAQMRGYQTEVSSYTRGLGRLSCAWKGYEPCHNEEEVVAVLGYDSERDLDNPTGSVFCAHGAGFVVEWDRVEEYMHLENVLPSREEKEQEIPVVVSERSRSAGGWQDEKELEEIFTRTYGAVKRQLPEAGRRVVSAPSYRPPKRAKEMDEYLLVDGYNIIFAWEDLRELAEKNIDGARTRLMDILSNYQGYRKCRVILVFDAYKVEGNPGEVIKYHNIYVVYTREAETADQYIEKTVHAIGRKYHVTVATSDGLEQVIILGQGGHRMSAQNLREEIEIAGKEIREECEKLPSGGKNLLFAGLDDETAEYMEDVRLGRRKV